MYARWQPSKGAGNTVAEWKPSLDSAAQGNQGEQYGKGRRGKGEYTTAGEKRPQDELTSFGAKRRGGEELGPNGSVKGNYRSFEGGKSNKGKGGKSTKGKGGKSTKGKGENSFEGGKSTKGKGENSFEGGKSTKGKGKKSFEGGKSIDGKGGKSHGGKGKKLKPPVSETWSTTTPDSEVEQKPAYGFNTRTTDTTRQFLTDAKFGDLPINANMKKSLRDVMRYENLTEVQKATLPVLLEGKDVFSRAKTGTGKTLAFLIPTVEKILSRPRTQQAIIGSIVLSPTRELAMQIYEEGRALTQFLPDFKSAIVFGGTNMNADRKKFTGRCDLLVATPGRLFDHLTNTHGFSDKVGGLHTLILDEADQLLEVGFRDSITNIIGFLPKERQSLLFSATVAASVRSVAEIALKPGYKFIDCVGDADESTVKNAKQTLIVGELEDSFNTLVALLQQCKQECPSSFKVVVFFVTARQTQFSSEAMNNINGLNVIEIHSRKSQSQRTAASDKFRKTTTGILFSSDVSARGLDYPNVTHVIQVGVPASREQYIHRVGRTARAGTSGAGILLLHSFEEYFVQQVKDLPLKRLARKEQAELDAYRMDETVVRKAILAVSADTKQKCYSAWLGYYNGLCPKRIRWSKPELVEWANYYALDCLYLSELPLMEKKTIGKMGLKGVPGLRLA